MHELTYDVASNIRNRFWKTTLITMAVIVVQFITTIIIVGVQCRPTNHYWNRNTSGQCVNITAFFHGKSYHHFHCLQKKRNTDQRPATNVFTTVTDVVILSLPIPMLIKL